MSELLTNFKDDILAESMEGKRRYQMITNEDGTVSFIDVTEYEQVGSEFGQAEINAIHREINSKFDSGDVVDPLVVDETGFAADAKLTGDALREVSAKINEITSEAVTSLSGTVNIGEMAGNNASTTRTIGFSKTFNVIPTVIASAHGKYSGHDYQVSVTISNITKGGFVAKISNPYPQIFTSIVLEWSATAPIVE